MASRDLFGPVTTDLVRFNAAGLMKALHLEDRCADAHAKLRGSLMARQATLDDSTDHALAQIY
jgi:hypothetical protein